MNKRIITLIITLGLLLTGCNGWGGLTYYGNYKTPIAETELDYRVATFPFRVWRYTVPDFGDAWGAHYELACWMMTGEKYRVFEGFDYGDMKYVESARCRGDAYVD